MRPNIFTTVKSFLDKSVLHSYLNHINITFIPKKANTIFIYDFQSISLCNYSYRINSKVIVHKLKIYLSDLITHFQSAFVARCMIQDNILVAQKAFHYLQTRRNTKKVYCALKLDMQNTYDLVEWDFPFNVLEMHGFHDQWI